MEHTDDPPPQIAPSAVEIEQLADVIAIQTDSQGIDREVAPVQVELDRARLHIGQRRRPFVELLARRDEIDLQSRGYLLRRAKLNRRQLIIAIQLVGSQRAHDGIIGSLIRKPLGRTETIMAVNLATELSAQFISQTNSVTFHHNIDI